MASIHKKDTVPELTLRSALWRTGARGWRCHVKLPGSPDVAFQRWRVAVFVDGVWWHGHPDHLPRGRRGAYWDAKIAGNVARDERVNRELASAGWTVVRIWDLDVLGDPGAASRRVLEALTARGWPRPVASSLS
jgi:DNA mismatch endonuclease (patch repair protein)